ANRTYETDRVSVPSLKRGVNKTPSKCKAKTEMERAEIFTVPRIGIDAIIEANRADRQLVAQARTDRVAHVVQAYVFRTRQEIARVGEDRALEFAKNRKTVFDIEHRIKFSANRMSVI